MANKEFNQYLSDEEGWNDLTSEFVIGNTSPSNTPTWEDVGNGIYFANFAEGDIAFLNFHLKHDILIGSKLYIHVHFAPKGTMAAGETIIWSIGYVSAERSNGQSLFGTLTTVPITYTATGTEIAGEHIVVEMSDAQAFVTPDVDALVSTKIERGNGTYANGVYGITADIHYQVGRISTPNKASPFV